jgi:hypothetical protein
MIRYHMPSAIHVTFGIFTAIDAVAGAAVDLRAAELAAIHAQSRSGPESLRDQLIPDRVLDQFRRGLRAQHLHNFVFVRLGRAR